MLVASKENEPDIENVLLNFGIHYKDLKSVPLDEYQWWTFDVSNFQLSYESCQNTSQNERYLPANNSQISSYQRDAGNDRVSNQVQSPTISQRIHSMVRRARCKTTTQQTLC